MHEVRLCDREEEDPFSYLMTRPRDYTFLVCPFQCVSGYPKQEAGNHACIHISACYDVHPVKDTKRIEITSWWVVDVRLTIRIQNLSTRECVQERCYAIGTCSRVDWV